MLKENKNDARKRIYTRTAKWYNAVLIGFLVSSGCSFALRNISMTMSMTSNPLLASSLSFGDLLFEAINISSDLFRILLAISLSVALAGIFMERSWARSLTAVLYGFVFVNQLVGFSRLYYQSIAESITRILIPNSILVIESAVFLGLGVFLILKRPTATQ